MISIFEPKEEHIVLRQIARRFAEKELEPGAKERDSNETADLNLFRLLSNYGLLGVLAPQRVGGLDLDATATVIVHEELAWADAGFALAYQSHEVFFINTLARSNPSELIDKAMLDACKGISIGAMAMSEPNAGTDVLGMLTKAERTGEHFIINGVKSWITNGVQPDGSLVDAALVYARTSGKGPHGLSLFLVDSQTPGFSLGTQITGKLGTRSATCAELIFQDCRVSSERLICPEGSGIVHLLRSLELERLSMAAIGVGIGLHALEIMNDYASTRKSEGKAIRSFGQVQRHIAETYSEVMAARAYLYTAANELDLNKSQPGFNADGVKIIASKAAVNAADRAIQVLGGNGYTVSYVVERLWRDARLLSIGGGTSETLQKNISRNLGRHRHRLT